MKTGPRYPSVLPSAESVRLSRLPACWSIRNPCGSADSRLTACRFDQIPPSTVTAPAGSVRKTAYGLPVESTGPAARLDVVVIVPPPDTGRHPVGAQGIAPLPDPDAV